MFTEILKSLWDHGLTLLDAALCVAVWFLYKEKARVEVEMASLRKSHEEALQKELEDMKKVVDALTGN